MLHVIDDSTSQKIPAITTQVLELYFLFYLAQIHSIRLDKFRRECQVGEFGWFKEKEFMNISGAERLSAQNLVKEIGPTTAH